jgi:hypothetical protein
LTPTSIELASLALLPNGLTEPTIRGVDAFLRAASSHESLRFQTFLLATFLNNDVPTTRRQVCHGATVLSKLFREIHGQLVDFGDFDETDSL